MFYTDPLNSLSFLVCWLARVAVEEEGYIHVHTCTHVCTHVHTCKKVESVSIESTTSDWDCDVMRKFVSLFLEAISQSTISFGVQPAIVPLCWERSKSFWWETPTQENQVLFNNTFQMFQYPVNSSTSRTQKYMENRVNFKYIHHNRCTTATKV